MTDNGRPEERENTLALLTRIETKLDAILEWIVSEDEEPQADPIAEAFQRMRQQRRRGS